jgi:SAM-dependent methyltransferase
MSKPQDPTWDFLPERYRDDWIAPFLEFAAPKLTPGCRVLDFGAGANPSIPIELRPDDCTYVGLDVVREELERAPAGSYDELVVGDIADHPEGLGGDFDLIVSWQVMEHVASMKRSLDGIHEALAPGGIFVSQFSGSNAWFARANRILPERFTEWAMHRLLGREPDSVFHAEYDRCDATRLHELLGSWSEYEIVSRYRGATYLAFSALAGRMYLPYENWAERKGHDDLATHYLIRAVK